jgi:hypothetical protein
MGAEEMIEVRKDKSSKTTERYILMWVIETWVK